MTLIEIGGSRTTYTLQQRWSHYLTLLLALVMILYGVNLRASVLGATEVYTNAQAGIRASYPSGWLLDEDGDYVFRVRDMSRIGFKTTIQVTTRPVGPDMSGFNVLDNLNITRSQSLATYGILNTEPYALPDETDATAMNYYFVDIEPNPFLESLPVVVAGLDILTIRGGQAIIITFQADSMSFDEARAIFDRFVSNLEL